MSERETLWKRAAMRAADDRFFLAAALSQYQSSHRMSESQLAAALGCTATELSRLGLCRCPDARSPAFAEEIGTIARRFGARPEALATVLRHTSFMQAFQLSAHLSAANGMPGAFAAQDRDEEEGVEDGHGADGEDERGDA